MRSTSTSSRATTAPTSSRTPSSSTPRRCASTRAAEGSSLLLHLVADAARDQRAHVETLADLVHGLGAVEVEDVDGQAMVAREQHRRLVERFQVLLDHRVVLD